MIGKDVTMSADKQELDIERQRRLRAARRVVIKLGTSLVTGPGGEVCAERIEPLMCSVAALKRAGRQVVLVSSGAVGLGAGRLGLHPSRMRDLPMDTRRTSRRVFPPPSYGPVATGTCASVARCRSNVGARTHGRMAW